MPATLTKSKLIKGADIEEAQKCFERNARNEDRKSPDQPAHLTLEGARMKGRDGNIWQVKKAGKSQRWVLVSRKEAVSKTHKPLAAKQSCKSCVTGPVKKRRTTRA